MYRIGLSVTNLRFNDRTRTLEVSHSIRASDFKSETNFLIDWLEGQNSFESPGAMGHRVLHLLNHTASNLPSQA